jgi:hypothetical protein
MTGSVPRGVTVKEAAYLFGRERRTVQSWIDRNPELEPVGRRGQALTYDYHELAQAEHHVRLRKSRVCAIVSS